MIALTIALLPDQDALNEANRLSQSVSSLGQTTQVGNLFHISLFQGFFQEVELETIKSQLTSLADSIQIFPLKFHDHLEISFGHLFWNLELGDILKTLHTKIVETLAIKRSGTLSIFLDPNLDWNAEQRSLIQSYGTPHVLRHFKPHITLQYNVENYALLNSVKPQRLFFTAHTLILGRIGCYGNLEDVLYSWKLK